MAVHLYTASARADAERCAKFQKLPDDFRAMFRHLANGGDAFEADFTEGILQAMQCTVTSGGQSSARRASSETVRRLHDFVRNSGFTRIRTDGDYETSNLAGLPDLGDVQQVAAWLDD